jgi:hypothetical protein
MDLHAGWSVFIPMSTYRIFYLRGGLLEAADEFSSDDVVAAAKTASSTHPELTAEIWRDDRKVAVVRPCTDHRLEPR